MKRTGWLLLIILFLSLASCRKYEQIRIVSAKVESLSMNGLRSADIVMSVEVSNPAGRILLEDASGTLKRFGKVLGNVSLAPLEVRPRTVGTYRVEARLTLDMGVGFTELMSLMDIRKLKECTVDISAKGKVAGTRVRKELKDIPLKKLLEDHNNEKI